VELVVSFGASMSETTYHCRCGVSCSSVSREEDGRLASVSDRPKFLPELVPVRCPWAARVVGYTSRQFVEGTFDVCDGNAQGIRGVSAPPADNRIAGE
jgi:hypothetical protein